MSLDHVKSVCLALRQAVREVVQDIGTNGLKATEKTSKFSPIEARTSAQDTG
jgi:Arc/MetJ family transcription regulator